MVSVTRPESKITFIHFFTIDKFWKNFELETTDLREIENINCSKILVLGEFVCKDTGEVFYTIQIEDRIFGWKCAGN